MLLADGFDEAIIGIGIRCGQGGIVVYDVGKCLEILQTRDGLTPMEALEYMDFNVVGAWMGEGTPMWVYPADVETIKEGACAEEEPALDLFALSSGTQELEP